MQDADLRYPIGPLQTGPPPDRARRLELLSQFADSAALLRAAVSGLSRTQLDTPYRLGGWTVRQVVHHLADAQANWYTRARLALTENEPVIKPFDETAWAELTDARNEPVEPSLAVIEGLNSRWVALFRSLGEDQWQRKMMHPERGPLALDIVLVTIVWHMRHHTAHIAELRKRMAEGAPAE